MLVPRLVLVVNNCRTEAASWVDASSSDWDSGQMNHKNCKANGKWGQHLYTPTKRPSKWKTASEVLQAYKPTIFQDALNIPCARFSTALISLVLTVQISLKKGALVFHQQISSRLCGSTPKWTVRAESERNLKSKHRLKDSHFKSHTQSCQILSPSRPI